MNNNAKKSLGARSTALSIRAKFLLVLAGVTIVSVFTVAALSIQSIVTTAGEAKASGEEKLRSQAEEFLIDLVVVNAKVYDQSMARVRQDAVNTARFAVSILSMDDLRGSEHWSADVLTRGAEGQYFNNANELSSAYVPNFVTLDADTKARLERMSLMDLVFPAVYESDDNTVAVYVIGRDSMTWYHPNVDLGSIVPPDLKVTEEIFFKPATPENNPERETIWTPVYDDPAGQGLMVSAIAPVYVRDTFWGVVGIDINLARLTAGIEDADPVAGGYLFLIDQEERALALAEPGYSDMVGRARKPGEYGADLSSGNSAFAPVLEQMKKGRTDVTTIRSVGEELYVAYAPLVSTGWSLAYVGRSDVILEAVRDLQLRLDESTDDLIWRRVVPVGFVILLGALMSGLWLTSRMLAPVRELVVASEHLGAGEWNHPLPPATDDEIGVLSRSFGKMAAELRSMMEGLEKRVAERTRELREANEKIRKNEKRLQEELDVARDIQRSMIPLIFPAFPDRREITIFATLEPAREVGGDFYDFYFVDSDHLYLVIGDVSGKGAGAALFMAVAKTLIKSHAAESLSPASIITKVNEELSENNERSMFVTLFIGVLNVRTGEFVYTNAGHNPPYLLRTDGSKTLYSKRHGPAVGAIGGVEYQQDSGEVAPGDVIYMYTDGVTEAMDLQNALFSNERLENLLERKIASDPQELVEATISEVKEFIGTAPQSDDITVLVVKSLERDS